LRAFESFEGRRSPASQAVTAALLWPDGLPGSWLMLLAGVCSWVVVRVLETGVL
jgi:hypothetical protein